MIIMLLCNIIMSERKNERERECKGETFLGVLIIWSTPNYIHMRVDKQKRWNKIQIQRREIIGCLTEKENLLAKKNSIIKKLVKKNIIN